MTHPSKASSLPLYSLPQETTPGGSDEVRWEIVATAPGIAVAHIIAGRLQAEGIPARAWQEAAGQAIGLTVGLLGTGYVSVPQEFADQAREILAIEEGEESDNESGAWQVESE